MTLAPTRPVVAWRFFDATIGAVTRLSESFVRLTLTGPDLHTFADNGYDQRFKLVLPDAHGSYESLPRDPDWYATWRLLPADRQNPIRTYTVRHVRAWAGEVDVDLVLHGETGPASRMAARAAVGDRLVVLGPNAEYDGPHGGLEFRPPPRHVGPTVLVGDETAAPAILSILAQLPGAAYGEAVLEVPHVDDIADVAAPAGFRVTWLVRQGATTLPVAVAGALDRLGIVGCDAATDPMPEPAEGEPLWEVPEQSAAAGAYAWIAGESSVVRELRRLLVRDRGLDKRSVAFMGYWREGVAG